MPDGFSIRPYDDGDFAAVADLWQACDLTRPWNDPATDIAFCLRAPNGGLFIGERDGKVIATVMTGHDGHRGVVYYLAVHPDTRGRGHGRDMLGYAEQWLAARGVWKVNLMIRDGNKPVRAFYEAVGYEQEPRTVMSRRIGDGETVGKLESVITYLEMTSPPGDTPRPPPGDHVAIVRAQRPTVDYYRFLYDGVGAPWLWYERRVIDDDALADLIDHPKVEVHVLTVRGVPAGFFELNRRHEPDIELAYFGLMPDFIGQGLGGYLLRRAIETAWSYGPDRLWVNTCTLDHPDALAVYKRAGFQPYDTKTLMIDDPRLVRPDLHWPVVNTD